MTIYREQAARRRHVCERCEKPIQSGQRYLRAALPPWTEPNWSAHWWVMRLHGHSWDDCPERVRPS